MCVNKYIYVTSRQNLRKQTRSQNVQLNLPCACVVKYLVFTISNSDVS